jgi:hypothetical protein
MKRVSPQGRLSAVILATSTPTDPKTGAYLEPKEQLKVLLEQEQELEELRALLRPQYWPRLYEMLKRVREQIRELESSISSNPSDSDVA